MHHLLAVMAIMLAMGSLAGCDSFRVVHLAPRHDGGTTMAAGDAQNEDAMVAAVKSVAAKSKLTCADNPSSGVRVACGPWFHSLSVMDGGATPMIELNLAHPGPSLGHDSDCDQIARWVQDLQTQLGEMDVTPTMQPCS